VFGSLREAYCDIHTRLAAALQALGVDASLAPAHRPIRPSARPGSCFAASVGGEILVAGRKLVGSAQVRRGAAFLQHGSILLEAPTSSTRGRRSPRYSNDRSLRRSADAVSAKLEPSGVAGRRVKC